MTTNKPNVQRYVNMGCPEEICRVDTMYESDDGDYVLYEDYEALQAECEALREALFEAQATMTSALPFEPVINEVTKKMLGTEVDRIKSLLSEGGGNKS